LERRRTNTTRWKSLAPILVLAALTSVGVGQVGWRRYLAIITDHSQVMGTVLRTDCSNQNDVVYSFPAHGGRQQGHDSWIGCRSLKGGDPIPVSFAASDPTNNIAGDGRGRFAKETITILAVSLLSSFIIVRALTGPRRKAEAETPSSDVTAR
jgi:hypothetical protein